MDKLIKQSYYGKIFGKLINAKFTPEQRKVIDEFQIYKYIFRYKEKNGKEDLLKAKYYLNDLIKLQ